MGKDMDGSFKDAVTEAILDRLTEGDSLSIICADEGMPSRKTVQRWQLDDAEFHDAVTRAREAGMHVIAERAVTAAKTATDASLGRLAFDADRWYLGKLSNAFSDKVRHVGGDKDDAPISVKLEGIQRVVYDPSNPDAS